MPEISRFYGIVIKMYFDDHHPPHFHAEYGESQALVQIETLAVISRVSPTPSYGPDYRMGILASTGIASSMG